MIKKAICVLCIKPDPIHIDFYSKFANCGYDVYFICDDNDIIIEQDPTIKFIQITDKICIENGYINCTSSQIKTPAAYDKAFYYFTHIDDSYDYIWFLEDDVFVPNTNTITDIDYSYDSTIDLLIENFIHYNDSKEWGHWPYLTHNKCENSYHAMVCGIRVSKNFLKIIKNYAADKSTFYFHEIMIPTLAIQNNLSVKKIPELQYITWNDTFNVLHIYSNNLYHPIKNLNQHVAYRKMLR